MAMDSVVTFALETVIGIVKTYADLIANSKSELAELQKVLEEVQACLKDAAEKTGMGHHFNLIRKQMREAIYDVEDALDTYLTDLEVAAAKAKDHPLKEKIKAAAGFKSTIDMAQTVKELRANLGPIYEKAKKELDRPGSQSLPEPGSQALVKKIQRDLTPRRDKVVTLKDVEKTMYEYIAEKTKRLDFIPIIGMAGLGKTTLTWKIFESEPVKNEYSNRIWVNVSQKFNPKDVLLKILKPLTDKDMSGMDIAGLEREVRTRLQNEKFLMVLDDNLLPVTNAKGKVIITTRDEKVGTGAGRRKPYKLREFTKEESWELLQLEVFEDLDECPEELEDVGKEIAKNCDGLPLTVVVIGGILVSLDAKTRPGVTKFDEWTEVAKDVLRFLQKDKDKLISEVVALSYYILPDELKECLVYMGVFPEDYDIPAWILIRLWIAEGLIEQKKDESLEETADEYLNDLVNRNLLMVSKTNPMGENKICRVHDVIHAFCISKAEEQNLFEEIKPSDKGIFPTPIAAAKKYHRVCFNSKLDKFFDSQGTEYPRVRSFLSFYKDPVKLGKEYNTSIPDNFKLLRVLNSNTIICDVFPPTIDELTHLRYVTLFVDALTTIPESISKLRNLQTFRVDTNSTTVKMDANLWAMLWLRHFKTKATLVLGKQKEGEGGKNLQTLSTLSADSCTETVAKKASNMKELRVRGNLTTLLDGKDNFLRKLICLEKLKLMHVRLGIRLPKTNCFPPNLKRLTLRNTWLEWSDMSILAQIEKLQVLKLKQNAFTGKKWTVSCKFSTLQYLLIAGANLEDWEVSSADHFPRLTCLSIKKCGNLQKIPMELAKKLQKLDIESLSESATASARAIQEEKKIIDQGEQKTRWSSQFQISIN
ncbi:hypothetical protein ACP275_04G155800 [Erythranthe tilingii]